MTWPDLGPRREQHHFDLLGSVSATSAFTGVITDAGLTGHVCYGVPYSAGLYGLEVSLLVRRTVGGADAYFVTLTWPTTWGGTGSYTTSGATYPHLYVLLDAPNEKLHVTGSCNWAHTWDSATLQLSLDGGATFVTVQTFGALVEMGINFDKRYDADDCQWGTGDNVALPTTSPACNACDTPVPPCSNCGSILPNSGLDIVASGTFGWRFESAPGVWAYDTIAIDNTTQPPAVVCICPYATVDVTATNSWDISAPADTHSVFLDHDAGAHSCTNDCGNFLSYCQWDLTQTLISRTTFVKAAPSNFGIDTTRRHVHSECNDGETFTPPDTSIMSSTTYVSVDKIVNSLIGIKDCYHKYAGSIGIDCTTCVPAGRDIFCTYLGEVLIDWPIKPPCKNALYSTHMMAVQEQGLMYAISSDGTDLILERFDLGAMDDQFVILTAAGGHTFGLAQIAWNPNGCNICVVYEDTGTIYEIRNMSTGTLGQWSTPVTVAAGLNPAIAIHLLSGIEFCAIYVTDRWKLYRLLPAGVAYTLVGDIAITATNDQTAGLEFSPIASNELVFKYNDVGTIKRITSTNFGVTWH